jgi:hypothetical protein
MPIFQGKCHYLGTSLALLLQFSSKQVANSGYSTNTTKFQANKVLTSKKFTNSYSMDEIFEKKAKYLKF